MTSDNAADRDEIVAAYLDGEATAAERARVEADPELMARVEVIGEVAELVAQPVLPPPVEVRNSHIAEALAASPTAPNVTAIAPKQSRWSPQYTRVLAAAAVILVVLFGGTLLLSQTDSGEDLATSSASTDDAASRADGGSVDDGGDDGDELATTESSAAADEGAGFDEEEAMDLAESEEALLDDAAGESAPAPTPAAPNEDAAEEAGAEDEADDADAESATARTAAPLDGDASTVDALAATVAEVLATEPAEVEANAPPADPSCPAELADAARGFAESVLVGSAMLSGATVDYVVVDDFGTLQLIVIDTLTCEFVAQTVLG